MVTVTDKAKDKVEHLIQDSGLDASYFLRVSVQGGGCSGLSYNLDFNEIPEYSHSIKYEKNKHILISIWNYIFNEFKKVSNMVEMVNLNLYHYK